MSDKQNPPLKLICDKCNWEGDISECRTMSDRGFTLYVFWWCIWKCPKCDHKLAEIDHKTPLDNPLQKYY